MNQPRHPKPTASKRGRRWKRRVGGIAALIGTAAALASSFAGQSSAGTTHRSATRDTQHAKPTIVLVHGAFANSASWSGVVARLQRRGYTVYAPPNPLLNLRGDSQTIADFVNTIPGPVVLVGHSYGGMVITDAATHTPNVKALVYVDAFAPAAGETTLELDARAPGSVLGGDPSKIYMSVPYPGAPTGDAYLYLKQGPFLKGFANDLPKAEGKVLAATQAAPTLSALNGKSTRPAWKTIPSWYVLGTIDGAIPPAVEQFMAQRAHAHITKVRAGHLSMISRPGVVTRVILDAARSVTG